MPSLFIKCFCWFGIFQTKSKEKSEHVSPPPKKQCASCRAALREAWTEPLCKTCIAYLVREETSTKEPSVQPSEMLTSFRKELEDTFQSFRSYLDKRPVAQSAESFTPSTHTYKLQAGEWLVSLRRRRMSLQDQRRKMRFPSENHTHNPEYQRG